MDDTPIIPPTAATPRLDKKRLPNELRAMSCDQAVIHAADGSARFAAGPTVVIAAVHGPKRPRNVSLEKHDRAVVEVSVKGLRAGPSGPVEREIERVVQGCLEAAVDLSLHPRTVISVIVQVVDDSGSLLAAVVNAVCLALLDAGIPLSFMFAALCVGQEADGTHTTLDITAAEEASFPCSATLVFKAEMTEGVAYPTANKDAIVAATTSGCFDLDSFDRLIATAAVGCTAVLGFIAQARYACV